MSTNGSMFEGVLFGHEQVKQGIVDLTNQTFDRLSARLTTYAEDPRRQVGEDTVILDHDEGRLWEGSEYGRVAVYVANRPSLLRTAQLLESTHDFVHPFKASWHSHFQLLDGATAGRYTGPQRYQPIGRVLLFHVLRDRYPRGDTDARESLMAPPEDYSKLPPEDWGERHKIGVEVVSRYADALAPGREATWRFGLFLQSRFDMPTPQRVTVSSFDGLVDTRDIKKSASGFKPTMTEKHTAAPYNVEDMSLLLAAAKDIRPVVSSVTSIEREQTAFNKLLRAYFQDSR